MNDTVFLVAAGLLAGAMNALAGGGSFVTLPALIAVGVPSVAANASSTVALVPGGLASAWTYFEAFGPVCGVPMRSMAAASLVGGFIGSLALLWTPSSAFDLILPWLLLAATLAIAFSRRLGAAVQRRVRPGPTLVIAIQFVLGLYGGYFGGAVGLMMLAAWSLLGAGDIKVMNGPRTLLVNAANAIAVVTFVVAGTVRWPQTVAVMLGALAGGFGGARLGRRLPAKAMRAVTILLTVVITALFFLRAYAPRA
jgi:uncharacterized membrane protein YfcA